MCCAFSALTFDWRIEQCLNLAMLRGKGWKNGENKAKNVVSVTFLAVFLAVFEFQPIRALDLIEIND